MWLLSFGHEEWFVWETDLAQTIQTVGEPGKLLLV
jgi:hypothetical protein